MSSFPKKKRNGTVRVANKWHLYTFALPSSMAPRHHCTVYFCNKMFDQNVIFILVWNALNWATTIVEPSNGLERKKNSHHRIYNWIECVVCGMCAAYEHAQQLPLLLRRFMFSIHRHNSTSYRNVMWQNELFASMPLENCCIAPAKLSPSIIRWNWFVITIKSGWLLTGKCREVQGNATS